MKEYIIPSLCLCALLCVSCQGSLDSYDSDDNTIQQTKAKYTLSASTGAATKQSVQNDGIIRWTPDDYLTVLFGDRDNLVEYDYGGPGAQYVTTGYYFTTCEDSISVDGRHTVFTLDDYGLADTFLEPEDSTVVAAYTGLFPLFSLNFSDPLAAPEDFENFWFRLSDEEYEEDGYNYFFAASQSRTIPHSIELEESCPSIAIGKTGRPLKFHSLFGALGLQLTGNVNLGLIKLVDNAHDIAGLFHYDHGTITIEDGASRSVSLECVGESYSSPIALSDTVRTFHFFLPDGSLSDGFTVEFYDANGILLHTVSTDKNNVINAGEVRMMPVIDIHAPATMVSGWDFYTIMNYYWDSSTWTGKRYDTINFITEADDMIGSPTDLTWFDHDLTQYGSKVYCKISTDSGYINRDEPWHLDVFTADSTIRITSLSNMFYGLQGLKTINGLEKTDMSQVTDINHAFSYCTGLTKIDLTGLDSAKIIDEENDYVLSACWYLTDINLGNLTFGVNPIVGEAGDIICNEVPTGTTIKLRCNATMKGRLLARIPERLHPTIEWTEVTE